MEFEKELGKTALELVKSENIQNKSADLLGMLFPFAGIKKKAVDLYIKEIEDSDLSTDTKMLLLLNAKQKFKQLKNQEKIVEIASVNAKEGTDFSETSGINEEWLDRFMNSAGFVSSEEMQWIWGKILANEFERPGTTPPNMIRVLSEITPDLAKAFRKICSMRVWICPLTEDENIEMVIPDILVPFNGHDSEFRGMGISFKMLNELETLGIIKISTVGGYVSKNIDNKKVLLCVGDKPEVIVEHQKNEIPIGNVMLTTVGEALQAITESEDVPNYHRMVREYMLKKNVKFVDEHDFQLTLEGDSLFISKKNNKK